MSAISANIRLGRLARRKSMRKSIGGSEVLVRFVVADANSVRAGRVLQERLEAFLQRSPDVVCTPEVLAARRL